MHFEFSTLFFDGFPYDLCFCVPSTYIGLTSEWHSVLNVKALVGAFNQEKALLSS